MRSHPPLQPCLLRSNTPLRDASYSLLQTSSGVHIRQNNPEKRNKTILIINSELCASFFCCHRSRLPRLPRGRLPRLLILLPTAAAGTNRKVQLPKLRLSGAQTAAFGLKFQQAWAVGSILLALGLTGALGEASEGVVRMGLCKKEPTGGRLLPKPTVPELLNAAQAAAETNLKP